MVINTRFTPWTTEEILFLKQNYNSNYDILSKGLRKSVRAIKHMIGRLDLKRDERRRWSDKEILVLSENFNFTPQDFIDKGLIKRSTFQIAKKLKVLRGSANRRFKLGWDIPSRDLAYFLGVVCSDFGIYKYHSYVVQKLTNTEMIIELKIVIDKVFGLPFYERDHFVDGVKYKQLGICSTELLSNFATKDGIICNNVRGPRDEWIEFIENKFSWVFDNNYFWYFIGGLYDGDGSLIRKRVSHVNGGIWYEISLAIKPVNSRTRIVDELKKRNFVFTPRSWDQNGLVNDVGIKGGQSEVDRFLGLVQCKIIRKKQKL
jgi:hypothetical protein